MIVSTIPSGLKVMKLLRASVATGSGARKRGAYSDVKIAQPCAFPRLGDAEPLCAENGESRFMNHEQTPWYRVPLTFCAFDRRSEPVAARYHRAVAAVPPSSCLLMAIEQHEVRAK